MRVLDTTALLHFPLASLTGLAAPIQLAELERIAPERVFVAETSAVEWRHPLDQSIEAARRMAAKTGALAGLSATDLHVLALTMAVGGPLVTDDYRLQNCCAAAGLEFEPVMTEGISELWSWLLFCSGCGASAVADDTSRGGELGVCERCASPLRLRRERR